MSYQPPGYSYTIYHSHRLWTWQDKLHLYYRFQAKAKAHPNRVFVVFEGKPYTYKQLEKGNDTLYFK